MSDVQVYYQLSSAFDLLLIFLCSLILTLTLTPPPNNTLLANVGHVRHTLSNGVLRYTDLRQNRAKLKMPVATWELKLVLCH